MTRVLLVEDDEQDALLLQRQLNKTEKFTIERVTRLRQCLDLLPKSQFDIILLDLKLPDSVGLETVTGLLSLDAIPPVVILTVLDDEELALTAVRHGAQDYLIKGHQNNQRLAHTLLYAIERRRSEDKLRYLAHHDYLTGLINRTLFQDRLTHTLIRAKRYRQRFALVFLDLDGLKNVNDTLGHDAGDQLLQMAAQRLRGCVRTSDTLARLGGDEFTVLLENIGDDQVCADIAKNILTIAQQPYLLGEQEIEVTWSIGIAIYPRDGSDANTLLRNADQAMYRAKQQGRNRYFFYSQES